MNIYLSGQKWFGRLVLEMAIEEGHTVIGVSAPAPKDGVMDRLWGIADLEGIPTLPSGELRADTLPAGVDLIVAAHSHDFIGRKTRNRCRIGAIGYHPSLLPLHRGRDSIEWAIRMGDRVTGGTVFWLSDTVDGGPIAAQEHVFIRPGQTAAELWREELQPLGIDLLRSALRDISAGRLVRVPQDSGLATWEPSIDQPPLYRPDLPMIGAGLDEYQIEMDGAALRRPRSRAYTHLHLKNG